MILGLGNTAYALPITVSYANDLPGYAPAGQQQIQQASLTLGGITVAGSNTLNFLEFNGIGVVGSLDINVDGTEYVDFLFDNGPVNNLSINDLIGAGGGSQTVEVFGLGGINLGTFTTSLAGLIDISSFVGNALITGFRFQSINSNSRLVSVTYTQRSIGVPEPSTLALLSLGFIGIGASRKLKKH
jgi:hypothetical protein